MLRFLLPGDRFAFEISPGRYGQGTLIAKVSVGHSVEVYPDSVSDPDDMSAWDEGTYPTFFDVIDSYSLFDRRLEGNWQRIATAVPPPHREVYRSTGFVYGTPGDRYHVDLLGQESAIGEEEFALFPAYRPAGNKAIIRRFSESD
jgi:hypothetical protein